MKGYVYILKSLNFPKTYTGSTDDISRRLKEHNDGKGNFSKRYKPWKLVYQEEFQDLKNAREMEKFLKTTSGRNFIKKLNII